MVLAHIELIFHPFCEVREGVLFFATSPLFFLSDVLSEAHPRGSLGELSNERFRIIL